MLMTAMQGLLEKYGIDPARIGRLEVSNARDVGAGFRWWHLVCCSDGRDACTVRWECSVCRKISPTVAIRCPDTRS